MVETAHLEDIEIDLLLEGVFQHYGWDFRGYAKSSITRRVKNLVASERLGNISHLQERVLHSPLIAEKLVASLSVPVTAMFRDPEFFLAFRHDVIPVLHTYPFIRIWHAGCSTGEEAYSMAILLFEENLLHKTKLYATDFNEHLLQKAKKGVFGLEHMRSYTANYQQSGGKAEFSSYYTACYQNAKLDQKISNNITFARHNLAMETSFNEFNVVICRNVLIYFAEALQKRVFKLFNDSLCRFGFLGLGDSENLRFTHIENDFSVISEDQKIYRRNL